MVLNYSCEYSHIDCVRVCSALWLQLCFGSHSHVCGFGLYVRAVYNCGFTRLGNDCYHYYHLCCAGHCVITVWYCTVLMVLPVVLHTYII